MCEKEGLFFLHNIAYEGPKKVGQPNVLSVGIQSGDVDRRGGIRYIRGYIAGPEYTL